MKRFIALMLTLCILFSMVAMNVTAVGEQTAVEENVEQEGVVPAQEQGEVAPIAEESAHTDHAACACAISGASCADHSTAAAAIEWKPAASASDIDTSKAGNYYLTADLVLSAVTVNQLYLQADINICLNGHNITRKAGETHTGALVRIGDSKSVVIMNCKATISNGRLAAGSAGITGGTNTNTLSGGIHVNKGATVGIYGVNISNNSCNGDNTSGWTAGGIIVAYDAGKAAPELKVAYSRFENNKATQSGGGAIIIRGGSADIRNTDFVGNEAKSRAGAIWACNGQPVLKLTNCSFTGNKTTDGSASGGACLMMDSGNAVLTNVSMTENENYGNHGTAITVNNSASVTLDSSNITNNSNKNAYPDKKAGVATIHDNAKVIVKGSTVIDNNMNGMGGTKAKECNLYLRTSGSKLTVDALKEGASIRVTTGDHTVDGDPDVFMTYGDNTPEIVAKNSDWLIYENLEAAGEKACIIGYNETDRFYFGTLVVHKHAACACGIGGAVCADHTTAAEGVKWQEWKSLTSLPTTAGYYYLTGEVTLTSQQMINADVKICLNGFDIKQGTRTEAASSRNGIIRVGDTGTVTIMNCCAVITDGKLAADSAGVKGFTADGTSGGAFHINSGRTLNLYGVQVSGNTNTNTNTNGWTAGAILAVANDNDKLELNINYCRFEDNKATNSSGGAIILRGGKADIRNTVFEGNEAKTKGGAIWTCNKVPEVTITDCTFTGNKVTDGSSSGGAGLYMDNGKVTLKNVSMTGNENAGNHGTAITYGGNSELTLDGCTITGNNNTSTSNAKKAGIALVNANAKLTVKGATVIDNNMNGLNNANPVECNLYLRVDGSKLYVGALEEGASIRITTGDHTVGDDPDVFMAYTNDTPVMNAASQPWLIYENREKAGNSTCYIGYSNDDQRFYFDTDSAHRHAACACAISGAACTVTGEEVRWTEWMSTTSLPTTVGYYYLADNVVLSSQQMINADVKICLNGFSITQGDRTEAAGSRNGIIRVGDTGTLTMLNCKAVIENGRLAEDSAGVKGFTADGTSGGAFHVNSGRTLNLYGIQVSGNTNTNSTHADWAPGAILAVANDNDKLQLNINYCRFDSNKTTNGNGGAITLRGGTANIQNTVFDGNEAKNKGGTIYVVNKASTLNITDCDFTANKTVDGEARGGACIHQSIGKATLVNVTMTGNENMGHDGTAITLTGSAELSLDSCTVTGNSNKNAYNSKKAGIVVVNDTAKIAVKGTTVIDGNMNGTGGSSPVECNLYLRAAGSKLTVDELLSGAMIYVSTGDHVVDNDPDVFLAYTDKTTVMDPKTQAWIIYENRLQAGNAYNIIGYSNDSERFYLGAISDHNHAACACAIDGINCNDHVDGNGTTIYGWAEWKFTDKLPTEAGNYYLTADVVLTKQQLINAKVSICLNGFSITQGERTEAAGARNGIIRVGDKGNVTLTNCKAVIKNGRLAENSAGIKGFTADGTSGAAVHINSGASFTAVGVVFSNNQCTNTNANGWTAGAILAVANANDALKLNLDYCRFDGNKAAQASGGAVIIRGGTAAITHCVFTGNEANGYQSVGGAVWLTNKSPKLTMSDCEFAGNKLTDANSQGGAAFYITSGSAELTNVTMTGNTNTGHHGTAITVGGDATLVLDSCKITDNTNLNTANAKKGGIATVSDNAKLVVRGATVVDNNIVGASGAGVKETNIYLRTAKSKVTVEQLEKGANVRISTGDHNVDSFTIIQPVEDPDSFLVKGVIGDWDPSWDSSWITYENNGRNVGFSSDEEILFYFDEPEDHTHCLCGDGRGVKCKHDEFGWVAWDRTDSLPTSSGYYYLTADVQALKSQNYAGVSDVFICLNGHTVTPAKNMNSVILNIYDDAHLTISDCTATGSGTGYKAGKFTGAKDGAVRIGKTDLGKDAVLNWYDGMIVKNQREYYGGGLRMVGKCTFNMYGGSISNNKCYKAHGGAIGADGGGGVINIYAGTFSGNSAKQSGGAIMAKKGTINVYGGLFTKNSATDNGGAIYNELGSVTITGGTFSYNKAPYQKNTKGGYVGQGGAVFVRGDGNNKYAIKLRISGGNFYGNEAWKGGAVLTLTYVQVNITGGKYYQNKANNNGGGIFIANDCRGKITNCTIYENTAVSGAGALSYKAEVELSDCTIRDNEAKEHGGGMLIQRESKVTMENVTFSGNVAPKNGGAIRADGLSQVTLNECLVTENTTGESGNIFISSEGTVLTLNDSSILNNVSEMSGGGLCAMGHARIVMNSGELKGNTAKEVGGAVWIRKGYMELHGGEVTGNTAGISGGGLQIEGIDIIAQRVILHMTDGVVSGNSAPSGGGVVLKSGTSIISGGTFENNTADYGGGIFGGSIGETIFENIVVRNNTANVNGGGIYLDRGSCNILTNCTVTGNYSKEDGAGIWINDDFEAKDLTVTGNESDNGVGGVYIESGNYDGRSYISSIIKIGGKVLITDNKGTASGMYIADGTLVNISGYGLTDGTKINVDLQSGLLTDTVIGSYDYEGADLQYVITAGDRSMTDPEKEAVAGENEPVTDESEQTQQEKDFPWIVLVIAGGALLLMLILLLLLRRKKNGGKAKS